jgi:alpha-tubulin suppressor-like RCC1 family protein
MSSGGVKCWGSGGFLGDGTTTLSTRPVDVVGVTTATAIALGNAHACALVSSPVRVLCWGSNEHGMLGATNLGGASYVPVIVDGVV